MPPPSSGSQQRPSLGPTTTSSRGELEGQCRNTAPNHPRCTHPSGEEHAHRSDCRDRIPEPPPFHAGRIGHESTPHLRASKLVELAHSLTMHGLIQPITVLSKDDRFEVVAGARRFRAAQIAELADVPTRILELSDEETLEVQIIENSQRQDVHPTRRLQATSGSWTFPATTWRRLRPSAARARATSMRGSPFCSIYRTLPRHSSRSASPPAMPT